MIKKNFYGFMAAISGVVSFILLLFFVFPALEDLKNLPSGSYSEVATNYIIKNYYVDIKVNEDNTFVISEDITVNFSEFSHGIVRAIPVFQQVTYETPNGQIQRKNYRTKVYNVSASETHEVYQEDGYFLIRLGSELHKRIGDRNYNIKYTVSLGDDRIKNFDQFYYNVFGHDWDTRINNASFKITFPKKLLPYEDNDYDLNLYYGKTGATNHKLISGNENTLVYTYTHDTFLKPYEGITLRIVLKQGYFETSKNILPDVAILIGIFLATFGSAYAFRKYKTNQVLTPVINFEVPDKMPPSEAGYIIDGVVDNKDIASLIVYWANKGYLNIIEGESKKSYTLKKVKDADDEMRDYEKQIFNSMFSHSDEVAMSNVGEKIHTNVLNAKMQIQTNNKAQNFNEKKENARIIFAGLASVMMALTATRVGIVGANPVGRLIGVVLALALYGSLFVFTKVIDNQYKKNNDYTKNYFLIALLVSVVIYAALAFSVYSADADYLSLTFVLIIPIIVLVYFITHINTRTDQGIKLLGELIGFRQFILLTEKDRIKMLANENPSMFYNILPYAYVLGVSNEWIDKFENIAIAQPSWFISSNYDVFDYLIFRSIFNNLMLSSVYQASFAPYTSSSSGRGFGGGSGFGGGGGFSGGGFSGGGGRSW